MDRHGLLGCMSACLKSSGAFIGYAVSDPARCQLVTAWSSHLFTASRAPIGCMRPACMCTDFTMPYPQAVHIRGRACRFSDAGINMQCAPMYMQAASTPYPKQSTCVNEHVRSQMVASAHAVHDVLVKAGDPTPAATELSAAAGNTERSKAHASSSSSSSG